MTLFAHGAVKDIHGLGHHVLDTQPVVAANKTLKESRTGFAKAMRLGHMHHGTAARHGVTPLAAKAAVCCSLAVGGEPAGIIDAFFFVRSEATFQIETIEVTHNVFLPLA